MSVVCDFLARDVQKTFDSSELATFLADGGDVNKPQPHYDGHTFLTLACAKYRDDLVAQILDCPEVNVNAPSACGNTPLRWLISDVTEAYAIERLGQTRKMLSRETYFIVLDELTRRRKRCTELLLSKNPKVAPDLQSTVLSKRKIGNRVYEILQLNATTPYSIEVFRPWLLKKHVADLNKKLVVLYAVKNGK